MSRRDDALAIIDQVVPSDYGDPRFTAIIDDLYREGPTSGTTCGYLTSYLLYQLGCRDEIVNRNDPAWGLKYGIGDNISRLVAGAKALGAWREGAKGIRPGDCYFISNGPALSEHVGVWIREGLTADAGQRNNAGHQAARYVKRAFDGRTLWTPNGAKPVVGYVDIDALPYAAPSSVSAGLDWLWLLAAATLGAWLLMED